MLDYSERWTLLPHHSLLTLNSALFSSVQPAPGRSCNTCAKNHCYLLFGPKLADESNPQRHKMQTDFNPQLPSSISSLPFPSSKPWRRAASSWLAPDLVFVLKDRVKGHILKPRRYLTAVSVWESLHVAGCGRAHADCCMTRVG